MGALPVMNDSRISNLVPSFGGSSRKVSSSDFSSERFRQIDEIEIRCQSVLPRAPHRERTSEGRDARTRAARVAGRVGSGSPHGACAHGPRACSRAREGTERWAIVAPASALLAASPRAPASRGRHRIAVHAGDGSGDGRATRSTSATTRRFLDGTFETAPTLVSVATGITHPPTADFSNQMPFPLLRRGPTRRFNDRRSPPHVSCVMQQSLHRSGETRVSMSRRPRRRTRRTTKPRTARAETSVAKRRARRE